MADLAGTRLVASALVGSSEDGPVPDNLSTHSYEPLDGISMSSPCAVDGRLIAGRGPPGSTQFRSRVIERFKCGLDTRRLRQDPETSLRAPVCLQIPFGHYVAGHVVTLLPDSIPEVLRQSDDDGELL